MCEALEELMEDKLKEREEHISKERIIQKLMKLIHISQTTHIPCRDSYHSVSA